jgi:DNA-binding MarR family transcriptional regulator
MSSNLNERICFNFYKGWREITSFYKETLGNSVTPQTFYLLELCDISEKITIKQLSEGLELDSSAVSTLVARMEKKGLVKRVHGTVDRRTVFVKLTELGHDLKQEFNNKMTQLDESISKNISEHDSKQLTSIVTQLKQNRQPRRKRTIN